MLSSSDVVGAQVVVLLGVVAGVHLVAELEVAEVGLGLAGEDAQQARLAGAVEAEHEQALAAAEVEADVLEHRRPAVGLAQPLRLDHRDAARRRGREPDVERLGRSAARGPARSRGGRCASRCCAPSPPWSPWRRSGRRPSAAGRSPWPAASPSSPAALVLGPRPLVLAVGAAVLDDLADRCLGRAVEVEHTGDRLVEQFEVVADHEQRALVLAQETHQPVPWRRRRGGSSARRGTARRSRRTGCGPARRGAAGRPTAC